MLDQNDFLELALSRDGSEIAKNRIRRLIKHRMANPAKGQHHKHHIAPASWYPEHAKNKKNIVKLTHREHYVVHMMLNRAFPDDLSMSRAFHLMSVFGVGSCKGTHKFSSSRQYDESRKWVSENMSANNPMKRDEVKAKKRKWERENYDSKPDDARNNYKTNNPMRDPEKIRKMVETRRKNGSYNRNTAAHLISSSGKAKIRMKKKNPMRDPDTARKSGMNSGKTRSSYGYWKTNVLNTKFYGNVDSLIDDILSGKDLKYVMENHGLKRDFAVSCIKRIKENENATSRTSP